MFHHFHDERHQPGQGSISGSQLDELIDYLGPDRILPAREWLSLALAGSLDPGDLCLTFDDTLRCQYDVALPVLRRHGLTAFWFVYTSVLEGQVECTELYRRFRTTCFADVEEFYETFFPLLYTVCPSFEVRRALAVFDPSEYLSEFPFYTDEDRRFRFVRDEVLGPQRYHEVMGEMMAARGADPAGLARDLWMDEACLLDLHEQGHVIGLHSHTHPTRLAELPLEHQRREYRRNHASLTRLLGTPPVCVSHPCSSYNSDTLAILRDLGVRLGFRANMARPATSPLEHPREDHANLIREMTSCDLPCSPATSLATSR